VGVMVLRGVVFVVLCTLVALAGLAAVQRRVPVGVREASNDVAGFVYAVQAVVYGVVLAFIVVASWEHFDAAAATVQREADHLAEIYTMAGHFPQPQGGEIRRVVRAYAETAIAEEWPAMARGQRSARMDQLVPQLQDLIGSASPATMKEQDVQLQALTAADDLAAARRLRLLESREGLHPLIWALLGVGAVLTIGYSYVFGVPGARAHGVLVAIVTITIAATLYVVQATSLPFSSELKVDPAPFDLVLHDIGP
jgi:hypothetical protein